MKSFLPQNWVLVILFAAFAVSRFENQRWVRARASGLQGSSESAGAFVDLTLTLSALGSLVYLVWYAVTRSWKEAVGLVVVGLASTLLYVFVIPSGDKLWRWGLGTLLVWPIMVGLFIVS